MKENITLYQTKSSIVNDAFGRTVFNLCMHRERHNYKVFALCGSAPGVGTTTVSIDLSILLSEIGWKTLLLDGDLRKSSRYKRLNDSHNLDVGLADYIIGTHEKEDIIHQTNWKNLYYISAGQADINHPLQALASSKMSNFFTALAEDFDCVIVDTPSLSAAVDSKFYAMRADAAIIVAAMDGSLKKHLEETYSQLAVSNANVIGVIETKVSLEEFKLYSKDFDYFTKMTTSPRYRERKKGGVR